MTQGRPRDSPTPNPFSAAGRARLRMRRRMLPLIVIALAASWLGGCIGGSDAPSQDFRVPTLGDGAEAVYEVNIEGDPVTYQLRVSLEPATVRSPTWNQTDGTIVTFSQSPVPSSPEKSDAYVLGRNMPTSYALDSCLDPMWERQPATPLSTDFVIDRERSAEAPPLVLLSGFTVPHLERLAREFGADWSDSVHRLVMDFGTRRLYAHAEGPEPPVVRVERVRVDDQGRESPDEWWVLQYAPGTPFPTDATFSEPTSSQTANLRLLEWSNDGTPLVNCSDGPAWVTAPGAMELTVSARAVADPPLPRSLQEVLGFIETDPTLVDFRSFTSDHPGAYASWWTFEPAVVNTEVGQEFAWRIRFAVEDEQGVVEVRCTSAVDGPGPAPAPWRCTDSTDHEPAPAPALAQLPQGLVSHDHVFAAWTDVVGSDPCWTGASWTLDYGTPRVGNIRLVTCDGVALEFSGTTGVVSFARGDAAMDAIFAPGA